MLDNNSNSNNHDNYNPPIINIESRTVDADIAGHVDVGASVRLAHHGNNSDLSDSQTRILSISTHACDGHTPDLIEYLIVL